MENNTSSPEEIKFEKPISIFEAIALQNQGKTTGKDVEPKAEKEKEEKKEKNRGDFLFPITMLF